ncbi:MAG: hypothetical protein P8Z00_22335 [Anaerolineales bacterium]
MLALFANNVAEIKLTEAVRSLMVALCVAFMLLLILRFVIREWHRAAAISVLVLLAFFSYGHLYLVLEEISPAGLDVGRHRILVPIYLAVFAVAIGWLARQKGDLRVLTQALNGAAVTALLLPVLQISLYSFREASTRIPDISNDPQHLRSSDSRSPPDVYYIILDGYSRDDILERFYQYDNKSFLNEITALGFFVARCSQSNYSQTQLSLASSLNLNYLSALEKGFTGDRTDRIGMPGLIKHSLVRRSLEKLGYTMVAFETGYYWTQVEDAGVYISPQSSVASLLDISGGLNSFEALLIRTSAGLVLADGATVLPGFTRLNLDHPHEIHRQRVLFTLDQLGKVAKMPGPKFIFAHIVSPHKPFVFGPQGESVLQEKNPLVGYRDQVAYLNSRMVPLLQKIISDSASPPIIVIQGDHGGVETESGDRQAILNAYHLPDDGSQRLYESITPVNTFRLIFNTYYEGRYALLEDISYFSTYQHPFELIPIPNTRPGCT